MKAKITWSHKPPSYWDKWYRMPTLWGELKKGKQMGIEKYEKGTEIRNRLDRMLNAEIRMRLAEGVGGNALILEMMEILECIDESLENEISGQETFYFEDDNPAVIEKPTKRYADRWMESKRAVEFTGISRTQLYNLRGEGHAAAKTDDKHATKLWWDVEDLWDHLANNSAAGYKSQRAHDIADGKVKRPIFV